MVTAAPARSPSATAIRVRERLRNSLYVVPTASILAALVAAELMTELDQAVAAGGEEFDVIVEVTAESVQAVTTAVAAAMLTFIGVVFALTILALQMAASQFSPRVMRTFVRSRVTKVTLGLFMATFAYSLTLLAATEPGSDTVASFVPVLGFVVLLVLVTATLFDFVGYVSHVVRLVRVGHVVHAVAAETRSAIDDAIPVAAGGTAVPAPPSEPRAGTVVAPRAGTIAAVDVARLAALADRADCVIVLHDRVGDDVAEGESIATVVGAAAPDPRSVQRCVVIDTERTMLEDPAFGIRQLVDIAIRALSPAVNDPTTAVQALDRIIELLAVIGHRADPVTHHLGRAGTVRVVRPVRDWATYVELSFTEIRRYGHDSPQVGRRLAAALDDLATALPSDRRPALEQQRRLLTESIAASGLPPGERAVLSIADRSGLG